MGLNVTATVEGVLWSDTAMLVPNRYASTGSIVLPEGAGYRIVLDDVPRSTWQFDVLVTGGTAGRASFDGMAWDVQTNRILRTDARPGTLTVTSQP